MLVPGAEVITAAQLADGIHPGDAGHARLAEVFGAAVAATVDAVGAARRGLKVAGSPSVERVVTVIDFLASRPGESFGLSELARALGMSKATAHGVCTTLTESGWLLRHPADKTYTLGPALIAAGHAAGARQLDLVDHARPQMEELAAQLAAQVVASSTVGDEMVLLATAGRPGPMWLAFTVGQRVPLAPPAGDRVPGVGRPRGRGAVAGPPGPGGHRRRQGAAALGAGASIRRRGYALNLEAVANLKLSRALSGHDSRRRALAVAVEDLAHEEYLLQELEGGATYRLSQISAPVFGVRRRGGVGPHRGGAAREADGGGDPPLRRRPARRGPPRDAVDPRVAPELTHDGRRSDTSVVNRRRAGRFRPHRARGRRHRGGVGDRPGLGGAAGRGRRGGGVRGPRRRRCRRTATAASTRRQGHGPWPAGST